MKDTPDESKLRRQAEEKLKEVTGGSEDFSEVTPETMSNLIHELQVHQIELKMQNDELRRIQGELENSRDRYSHLYDFAPVGYFTMREKGIIEKVNLTGADMIGIERSALIGEPFSRLILRDDQDIFYEHRLRLLETKTLQSCDLRLVKKDGHEFYAHMECIVINNKGDDLWQIRAAVNDITEQKRAEEERQLLISKLTDALSQIKKLSGLLPICQHCKKVRDDKGYWNQIESYIKDHSEAEFSHSICRECAKKYYPDMGIYDD